MEKIEISVKGMNLEYKLDQEEEEPVEHIKTGGNKGKRDMMLWLRRRRTLRENG
jgi:hypothetical protein